MVGLWQDTRPNPVRELARCPDYVSPFAFVRFNFIPRLSITIAVALYPARGPIDLINSVENFRLARRNVDTYPAIRT